MADHIDRSPERREVLFDESQYKEPTPERTEHADVEGLLRRLVLLEMALFPDPDDYDVEVVKDAADALRTLVIERDEYHKLVLIGEGELRERDTQAERLETALQRPKSR